MYTYAYSSTVLYMDPYGLFCMSKKLIKIAAATVGGAVTGGISNPTPWGILVGAGMGGISETLVQNYSTLDGAAGKSATGLVAGYLGPSRGSSNRARSVGALAGALGGLTQSQTNGDFANTAAGGLGGVLGGVAGELLVPQRQFAGNSGAMLFGSLRGGFAGAVGGFVQDAIEVGLARFECKGDACERKN